MIGRSGVIAIACLLGSCASFDESRTTTSDAGAPSNDGGIGEAAGGRFCDGHVEAFFCDDFEENLLGFGWSETAKGEGGALEKVDGALSARGVAAGTGQSWAYLRKDIDDKTEDVVLSFSMKNLRLGADTIEAGALFVNDPQDRRYGFAIYVSPEGTLAVSEVGIDGSGKSLTLQKRAFDKSPPPQEWARLRFHWKISDPATLKVYVNEASTPSLDITLTPSFRAGIRKALVGLTHFNEAGAGVLIDDVLIERR
jgi:hypothetical protein